MGSASLKLLCKLMSHSADVGEPLTKLQFKHRMRHTCGQPSELLALT